MKVGNANKLNKLLSDGGKISLSDIDEVMNISYLIGQS